MPRAASPTTTSRDSYGSLRLRAGEILFVEGAPGRAAYLVKTGEIDIYITRDGRETVVARRGAGELIGEIAVIDRGPRSASARAAVDCKLVVIDAEKLEGRASSSDPILRICLRVVIARYREAMAHLQTAPAAPSPHASEPAAGRAPAGRSYAGATDMLRMERDLSRGLRANEFVLFFQPIVNLSTRRLAGFEALMRWRHPERGLVPPSEFIPMAEACGLIVDLTQCVLCQIGHVLPLVLEAERANADGTERLFVTVNISAMDLLQPAFSQTVCDMLARVGVAASRLKIEIAESMIMTDIGRATAALQMFHRAGIGVAIDNFGTGWSSLSSLATLPISTLKIHRSFVQTMLGEPVQRRIVSTLLRLAAALDIPAVAEGIAGEPEAAALAAMHCDYGQGYLFGCPAPFESMISVIRSWSAAPGVAAQTVCALVPAIP